MLGHGKPPDLLSKPRNKTMTAHISDKVKNKEALLPCPFCGGEASIGLTDEEGNRRGGDYLNDPWYGVGFPIIHEEKHNKDCPIATHEDELLGSFLYDTKEEAITAWNTRAGLTKQAEAVDVEDKRYKSGVNMTGKDVRRVD